MMVERIYESIVAGDLERALEGLKQALEDGISPVSILNEGMIAGMVEVGRLYEEQEYFVPEMLISARAMKHCLALLKPYLVDARIEPIGRVVMATVKGDLHDIGKNLVAMMLEGVGFEVIDLGVDVSPERMVAAVQQYRPDFVAMSALLTTTMPGLAQTIDAFRAAGLSDRFRVAVGGAPVNQAYAAQIGADLYAPDAAAAAALLRHRLHSEA